MNRPQLTGRFDESTKPSADPVHWSLDSPSLPVGKVPETPALPAPQGWSNTIRSKIVVSTRPLPARDDVAYGCVTRKMCLVLPRSNGIAARKTSWFEVPSTPW